MDSETVEEIKRHFGVVAEGLRDELKGHTSQVAEGLRDELKGHTSQIAEGLRQEFKADTRVVAEDLREELKRHIGIVTEGLRSEVQLVAESVVALDERVDRRFNGFEKRSEEQFEELKTMIRLTYSDLDKRIRSR